MPAAVPLSLSSVLSPLRRKEYGAGRTRALRRRRETLGPRWCARLVPTDCFTGLLGDVLAAEQRHEDEVRDSRGEEAPEPRPGLEPVEPGSLVAGNADAPADDVEPTDKRRNDSDQQGDDRVRVDAPRVSVAVDAVLSIELEQVEPPAPEQPVVDDHDAADGAEEAAVAGQPGDRVRERVEEQDPWLQQRADDRGDDHPRGPVQPLR